MVYLFLRADSQHDSPINNDPERAKRRRKLLGPGTPDVSPAASDTEATDTEMSNDLVRATQLNRVRDGLGPVPHRGIGTAVTNGRPEHSYMR
ncbi:hypothetical protein SARC_10147 [Sphaeroforma arctica JP610]|uniref:Uncharacterized protein n=1 Tax=Sphaeroforma arctica JP610 TaxID=667725 RepID=A0A0L0FKS6_9EUKA|nr:hypothetical protein SARC_10147 [Sphaeroforma arctica JP610]KNC77389.1 hypothetical protein SARC_10147 [Sphaeroforma arctica JP610]|eukprot:XP_014151291.1 hypothetical protein SARC_10147 [Sphaeroforma arctica JP610]